MNNKIFYSLFLIVLTINCATEHDEGSANFNLNESAFTSLSDLVKNYKIVLLSGEENFLTRRVSKIQGGDSNLFVLDRQNMSGRLLIFDQHGRAITKIDAMGKGPGEYLQIADFDVDPQKKEIFIADPGNRKVLKFSFSGDHLYSKPVNHWIKNINYLPGKNKETIIVTSTLGSHSTEDGDNYDIFIFDAEMNLKGRGLPFAKPNQAGMGNGFNLYETPKGVSYYRTFTDSVYQINRQGELLFSKAFNFPADILPDDKIMAHMMGKVSLREYIYFVAYFENNNVSAFTYSWDGKDYIGVFDKTKNWSKVAKIPKLSTCEECFRLNLVGAFDHYLITYSTSDGLAELLDVIDPSREKCLNAEILSEIHKLDENSNSVVLFLTI